MSEKGEGGREEFRRVRHECRSRRWMRVENTKGEGILKKGRVKISRSRRSKTKEESIERRSRTTNERRRQTRKGLRTRNASISNQVSNRTEELRVENEDLGRRKKKKKKKTKDA